MMVTVPLSIIQTPNALVSQVTNAIVPCEALAVSIRLEYTPSIVGLMIDLTEAARKLNEITFQSAYIDLSASAETLDLIVPATGQVVVARGYTQGYYALFVPMPAKVIAVLETPPAGIIAIPLILANTPIPPMIWTTQ